MTTQEIEKLQQALYQAPVLFEWEYKGHGTGGKLSVIFKWVVALIGGSFLPVVALLSGESIDFNDNINDIGFWVLISFGVLFTLMSRYLFPDKANTFI